MTSSLWVSTRGDSTHLTNQLSDDGLTMEKVRQGAVTLSSPTKALKRRVMSDPPLIDHHWGSCASMDSVVSRAT